MLKWNVKVQPARVYRWLQDSLGSPEKECKIAGFFQTSKFKPFWISRMLVEVVDMVPTKIWCEFQLATLVEHRWILRWFSYSQVRYGFVCLHVSACSSSMYIYVYVLSDYVINIHILIFSYIHIQHIMYGLSPPINAAMTSKQTSVGHGSSLELSPGIPWSSSLIWLRKRFLPYTGYW